jgi:hypothetical protein
MVHTALLPLLLSALGSWSTVAPCPTALFYAPPATAKQGGGSCFALGQLQGTTLPMQLKGAACASYTNTQKREAQPPSCTAVTATPKTSKLRRYAVPQGRRVRRGPIAMGGAALIPGDTHARLLHIKTGAPERAPAALCGAGCSAVCVAVHLCFAARCCAVCIAQHQFIGWHALAHVACAEVGVRRMVAEAAVTPPALP